MVNLITLLSENPARRPPPGMGTLGEQEYRHGHIDTCRDIG